MITRFLTDVTVRFNPFTAPAKTARTFLAHLPPNARSNMKINTALLPRTATGPTKLFLKFKDGKEMDLDLDKLKIKDVMVEVDRHARLLSRQEELSGS
ncbi:mitochondrial ribosomal protein L44 [Patellaria atrata CBS 101060]|uniref:Large ribosomal subunit protein mL53 n=1 Tax=Patellaria atrata CBS 101060 TaxID=1346257 RepID=A0A9P4VJP8_9PEZI|nr:mitochondrial ribosomal protein L44 [Patellaria atrata CBS 101060]